MSRFRRIKNRMKKKKGKKMPEQQHKHDHPPGSQGPPQGPQPDQSQQPGPKVIGQITIDVLENLNVLVKNFPDGYGISMTVLINAMSAVNQFFMEKQEVTQSPIVVAKPVMSAADIDKISRKN